jgi:hypothetical protein
MEGYVPDAIAVGPQKKLAIEVVFDGKLDVNVQIPELAERRGPPFAS